MTCELCNFDSPKATATAIILKDNSLLTLLRNQEPYKGQWDLPGGYLQRGETPEQGMRRELKEELGVEASLTHIKALPGLATWKNNIFPVLSHFYLADIENQEIRLDMENTDYIYQSLNTIKPEAIAWDTNQEMVRFLKENYTFDISRVKELISQLDPSTEVKEQSLYQALICGKVITEYDGTKLIGMGWIFPRTTLLRKQAVIEDMIVDEAYRGKGLGRKILKGLMEWAQNQGVEVIELTTNPKREAANALYKSEGFLLHETNHYLLKR